MPPEPLLDVRDLSVALRSKARTSLPWGFWWNLSKPAPEVHGPLPAPSHVHMVLRGVSLQIPTASIVGLCGRSGSGKTTLALALLNLLPDSRYRVSGEVRLAGRDLLPLAEREWERVRGAEIAMILQDPLLALNPVIRVRRQIGEVLRAHQCEGDPAELLKLAGIAAPQRILEAYPHELSGGERQRVTIAQALACRPRLIIGDEPFTALDGPRIVELAALFRRLRDTLGTSFLLIGHHPGTLALTADRTLTLSDGALVEGAARAG